MHESMRPENERICYDPYALYFISDRIFSAQNRSDQIKRAVSDWETHFPGICNAILARTRFIDDCLEEAIQDGIQQVVILGAGYDTRAFRFKALTDHVAVFELDHRTTQKRKLEIIQRHLDGNTSSTRFIPIDFSVEDIADKLFAHGYDHHLKTLFIWEGVTYYICASAVDRTLDFVNHYSPAQSRVVFDCFPSTVADGTTQLPEARALSQGLKRLGEEILFGIDLDQIFAFMNTRGFAATINLAGTEYMKANFKGPNKSRNVSDMFIFVQAMVS